MCNVLHITLVQNQSFLHHFCHFTFPIILQALPLDIDADVNEVSCMLCSLSKTLF
jgi:hypothetical protein